MQPLEIALLLVPVPILAWCIVTRRSPVWTRTLATLAVLLMAVQIIVEGHRWQMVPGYLVSTWLFLSLAWPRVPGPGIWMGLAGLICLLGSAALCTLMPVFKLPRPTGPFLIGSVTRHLVDSSRQEIQGTRPGAHRELMIQVWYPAAYPGPGRSYCSPAEMPLKKKHLALVRTHAATGVPFASSPGRFPVLIFSPSWTGGRIQNTFQAEELASHGFVVAGIDHPYATHKTVFPDGRVIKSVAGDWLDFSSESKFESSLRSANQQLQIRTADARFVLDTLERWDRDDPEKLFTDRLDLARVGIWGHSFGGAVAAEACRLDPRFAAAIDLDGCLFGESAAAGVEQPFLVMSSDGPLPTASQLAASTGPRHRTLAFIDRDGRNIQHSFATYGGYFLMIQGASHLSFCDSPLYTPLGRWMGFERIDVVRAMRIINEYTLAFFNQHLNGRIEPLLKGPSFQFPEVRLQVWQAPERERIPSAPAPIAGASTINQ